MSQPSIYILRLVKGKYYVGRSDNPMARYEEHMMGEGSTWTRLFKPIGVVAVFPETSRWDEDRYVKEYMERHGIENVRGGSYSEIELSPAQKEVLRREIRGATDVCFHCGAADHFAVDCTRHVPTPKLRAIECFNCGNCGHYARDCPYESESDSEYDSEESEFEDSYDSY